jgi:hypothetical protein
MLIATANICFLAAGYFAFHVTKRTILEHKLDMIRAFRRQVR